MTKNLMCVECTKDSCARLLCFLTWTKTKPIRKQT